MNQLNAIGRVGKDAEVRYTNDQTPIASWSLAISSGFGEKAVTTWLNCSLFGKRAEKLAQYIIKGSQMGVTGEILLREYVDKEGMKKSTLECRVNDLTLVGGRQTNSEARQPAGTQSESNLPDAGFDDPDDTVPF
jgi:single-strand DNA-binding protein